MFAVDRRGESEESGDDETRRKSINGEVDPNQPTATSNLMSTHLQLRDTHIKKCGFYESGWHQYAKVYQIVTDLSVKLLCIILFYSLIHVNLINTFVPLSLPKVFFFLTLLKVKEESPVDMDTITLDPEEEVRKHINIFSSHFFLN